MRAPGGGRFMRLTAENLTCQRGERLLFEGLSFALDAGRLMTLVGPNGTGKSSLLRIIAGLLRADEGTVSFSADGKSTADVQPYLHYLAHRDALKDALSVEENLAFWRGYFGGRGDIHKALEAVGIGRLAPLPAGVLSAGQRRRLALARLLVVRRPVWLLDEPTAALDKASEANFGQLLDDHLAAGGMAVAATHMPLPRPPDETLDLSASGRVSAQPAAVR